jgi:DNA helicase-2/ATP-dependent DNA helicase PcrA
VPSGRFRESIADSQGYGGTPSAKEKKVWSGAISSVRNNGDLQLAVGDMIEHADFGKGKVVATAGEGARQTAEIHFGSVGIKRLLVKVAPIQKV